MKIALIGCGAAARQYYVPALRSMLDPRTEACLVDTDADQARRLAGELGGGAVFSDYREVLGSVDGAIVAVPHSLHYRVAMDALSAGVHVLCEKPLAESLREVDELEATAQANGVALCVNNTRRMFPHLREARRLIEAGAVGQIRSISYAEGSVFDWQSATGFYVDPRVSAKGILLDLGAHVLDTICWWLGRTPGLVRFEDDSYGGPESFASLHARTSDCEVRVLLNRLSAIDSKFTIVGDAGTIEGRPMEWQKLYVETASGRRRVKAKPTTKTYEQFAVPVVRNFLQVIRGGERPLVSGRDVRASIGLIEECYRNRQRYRMPAYERAARVVPTGARILVTGAAGFIGARVVELLHFAGDRDVRAGIRRWPSAARLGRFPVEIRRVDVMDPASLKPALDDVDAVVHCAVGNRAVTATGTRNLLAAALEHEVKRFIHISTADVYGEVDGRIDEDRPFRRTGTDYNASKIEAEKAVWEYADRGLSVTVLRPSIVYGPFSADWSTRLARMFLAGKGGIYESLGEGMCNAVFVDDLVAAIFHCLNDEAAGGNAFNVVGPELVTWNDYFVRFSRAMGLPPLPVIETGRARMKTVLMQPLRSLGTLVRNHCMGPVKKLAAASPAAKLLMKSAEQALKTTPSPAHLKLFGRKMVLSGEKLRKAGFSPAWSLDEGLRATVEWLRQQGFLGIEDPPRMLGQAVPQPAALNRLQRRVEPTTNRL